MKRGLDIPLHTASIANTNLIIASICCHQLMGYMQCATSKPYAR